MLPELSGLEVTRQVRAESSVPIVMLTARDAEVDKVVGLELGADDYVTKPFSLRELSARIRAVLRRGESLVPGAAAARDARARSRSTSPGHRVLRDGREVPLKPKVFELLAFLLRHPGQVVSRDQLLERVWGYDYPGETRTVDVHVHWLRSAIEPEPAEPDDHPDGPRRRLRPPPPGARRPATCLTLRRHVHALNISALIVPHETRTMALLESMPLDHRSCGRESAPRRRGRLGARSPLRVLGGGDSRARRRGDPPPPGPLGRARGAAPLAVGRAIAERSTPSSRQLAPIRTRASLLSSWQRESRRSPDGPPRLRDRLARPGARRSGGLRPATLAGGRAWSASQDAG